GPGRGRLEVRLRRALALVGALGLAAWLAGAGSVFPSAQAATGGGDFIVRCFYNGNVKPMDPILNPGSSNTPHLHIFFGNLIQGTSSFPSIRAGEQGGAGTMENNGLSPQTNCQDSKDTAGYWTPEPFIAGSPQLPGGGC